MASTTSSRWCPSWWGIPSTSTSASTWTGSWNWWTPWAAVEFNVPVEMYYNDPSQDLNIFFQPGMLHLDGQEAMEVCRFRKNADGTGYPMGDIQRSETVRNLMVTVAKKLVANIGKLDQFVDILQRNVETTSPAPT